MAIIQVSRIGERFAVLEDGTVIPNSYRETRGEAMRFALDYKENNS